MADSYIDIIDIRGGQNSADAPLAIPQDQCVEAVNVDWSDGTLGRKRDGMEAVSMIGSGLSSVPVALVRHTPVASEAYAELWAFDGSSKVARYSDAQWSQVTPTDIVSPSNVREVYGASLNGKLFLAYKSAVDRLHVYDGTLRRAGIAAPAAAPTAENTGSGTYAATVRYYRQRFTAQSSGVTVRRSEPSATVTFTPSGTGTGVLVTRAATPSGESVTHWELYASADNLNFWLLATVAIGTDTYTDSANPSDYSDGTVDYEVGEHLPFPSVKFLLADENRLIGAGSHEQALYASRLFFSPVVGSGVGDDERTPDSSDWQNHLDLDNQDGGGITGIGGPINNSPYAFKLSQIYKLVRTGKAKSPYRPVTISKTVGALNQDSIVEGVDENDTPSLYFLALDGPRRISSSNGLQWLGSDVRDIWKTINLSATVVSHAVYYRDLRQVWFWIATGASSTPNKILVYDVRRGRTSEFGTTKGWSVFTGTIAQASCSVMFAATLGLSTVSLDLKPYIDYSTALARCGTGTTDAGTAFQAYVKTRPYFVAGLGRKAGVMDGTLLAKAAAGVSVQVTVDRDFGAEERSFSVSLAPAASEARVIRQVEDLSMADATALQFEIGDASAVSSAWTLEGLSVLPRVEGSR